MKSNDYTRKYDAAIAYYEKGDYVKALGLLEELVSVYRGTDKAEKIMYYYAFATYSNGEYLLAGYHFSNYIKTFPTSPKVEECAFMNAYCYYLESPRYSLDQTDTKNAMKELQSFINKYPNSPKVTEANGLIDKLRAKLEQKAYEIAKQYFFIEDYQAAAVSFENVLKDFPDTKYREEAMFLVIKADFSYAEKSIEKKKVLRYKATIDAYNKFISYYPSDSKYNKEAEGYFTSAQKQLDKLPKQ